MKILVIGGSYFLGRVFVMLASKEHDITVVNRGTLPLTGLPVRELHADRHDASFFGTLTENYDAVVDFCAYAPGDVAGILDNLQGNVKQYILISTVDIYAHGKETSEYKRKEDYPGESVRYAGEIGDYIAGKLAAEQELKEIGKRKGLPVTILRPAVLYGPMNYAPRERIFIECMKKNHALPQITDADGSSQLVYVKDAALAVIACLNNEKAYDECFNICGNETITYDRFADALIQASPVDITLIPLTLEEAERQGFVITFPIKKEENHLCDNQKSRDILGLQYTSLEEGMKRTVAQTEIKNGIEIKQKKRRGNYAENNYPGLE